MRPVWFMLIPLLLATPTALASDLQAEIAYIAQRWAILKYQTADSDEQVAGLQQLADDAAQLSVSHPDAPEPPLWQAVALGTKAYLVGGRTALRDVTRARDLALAALDKGTPETSGYAYTLLGAIYHEVPGWPIAFGDNSKALRYFDRAMRLNPNSMDAHYYYGEYLMDRGETEKARNMLHAALNLPDRPELAVAHEDRRRQVRDALDELSNQ